MHILQVTLGFLPAESWGGPVKIVYNNARELIRRGHKVSIYCTNLFDKKQEIRPHTFEAEIDGIRVVYFKTWRIPRWPGTLGPIWLPELKTRLQYERNRFDLIHLNGYRSPMNLQLVDAVQGTEIPLVLQPHGTMPVIVNSFVAKRLYDRLFGRRELARVKAFVALQESEKRQIMAHGVPAGKIAVIPNGLSLNGRHPESPRGDFRRRYGLPAEKKLILFLGRINRKKGTDMLVEAFAQLDDPDAVLVIAGPDDGQLLEVQSLVARHRLTGQVIFPGLLSGADVLEAYRAADLFVLPCRTDTFPTTIMEACLAGLPMVITEGCEIAHLVENRVAQVVPFDPGAFAGAMRRVLSDAALYGAYKSNCSSLMRDTFSVEATVDQLEGLYRRIVSGNGTRAN